MRYESSRRSGNVEDRRHLGGGKVAAGGGIVTILIAVAYVMMGGDPSALTGAGGFPAGGGGAAPTQSVYAPEEEARLADFVSAVLGDTEDVWGELLPAKMGRPYVQPHLVLFSGQVESACGAADAAVGPFYCPGDSKVYIDLSFYAELQKRFRAPGDFAQAYVIAHEVGHHVQHLLGISDKVDREQAGLSKAAANALSVRLELQADFFAGVWAHHAQRTRNILEEGDLEEALNAATAIGDDTLQKQARGRVVPDSFTHGTSAQRVAWFRRGFQSGDPKAGDTFDDRVFTSVR
jgi:predicted metalloprotease